MKKMIFAILLLTAVALQAQAQEKKFWIGGSLGFSSTQQPNVSEDSGSLTILPEFGYNFNERWAVGIRLGLQNADVATEVNYFDVQTFSAAPFARYTFLNWKALRVFVDGGIGFSDSTGDISSNADLHNTTFGLFVDPGFSLRLSDRFALIGSTNLFSATYNAQSIGAQGDKTKTYAASLDSPFNFDNIELGFSFKF